MQLRYVVFYYLTTASLLIAIGLGILVTAQEIDALHDRLRLASYITGFLVCLVSAAFAILGRYNVARNLICVSVLLTFVLLTISRFMIPID